MGGAAPPTEAPSEEPQEDELMKHWNLYEVTMQEYNPLKVIAPDGQAAVDAIFKMLMDQGSHTDPVLESCALLDSDILVAP